MNSTVVVLIMGVSGSGKTTIGHLLADSLRWRFADADNFHSAENIRKMHAGIPLSDADRQPWLNAVRQAIDHWLETHTPTVLACSALKAEYREFLLQHADQVKVVYLKGSYDLLQQRLQQRHGHYMNPELLKSQLETLEEPKDALQVEVSAPPEAIVGTIRSQLNL